MHQNLLRLAPILMMMCLLLLAVRGTTGYVVLSPQGHYTVFENNASAAFNCYGDGSVVVWILNGSVYGPVHQRRGIAYSLSAAGATVSSTLIIPCNSTSNNNTEVICKVADGTFTNVQTSNSSNLTVQGPLDAPYNFSVARSSISFILSWGAPFSLHNIEIFNYTVCTNITIYGCKTIPSDPDCTYPRTCTSSVDFSDPSLNGTNKTIMDYGDPILFKFFAINGAGNGIMANFTYVYSLIKEAGYPCLPPSDCKPTCTSESQLTLQNKVKLDTPCYTDVACLQVITIPAPNDEVQYSEVKAPHTEEVSLDQMPLSDVAC